MKRHGLVLLCGMVCPLLMGSCPWIPSAPQTKILFMSNRDGVDLDSGIYAMDTDGTHATAWTTLKNAGASFDFRGSRMVFGAYSWATAPASSIWLLRINGGGFTPLTDTSGNDSGPLITSDGSRVVFQSELPNLEVRSVKIDGGGLVNLSSNPGEDFLPAVRPNSTQVAFTSRRDGDSEIYVVDQAGGTAVNLTNNHKADDSQPVYSPDGSKIAFLSNRDGNQEVYLMNADGTGQTNVSNHAGDDFNAKFSPDGTKISFVSGSAVGHFEIWVADLVAGGTLRLTDQLDMAHEYNWSPNSQQIGFVSTQDGPANVYVINTDAAGLVNLTHDSAGAYGPLWSPDGATLFFETIRDGNWEIYSMAPDGSAQTNLTNNPADDRLRQVVEVPG
jgi:Tol biopolymer transport system component